MVYVKPTADIFFRYLLGSKHNKDLLLDFINAVLDNASLSPVRSVEIMNPFNLKTSVFDKESILDVKAMSSQGKAIIIEIQSVGNEHFVSRSLYYWAKNYSGQLAAGLEYHTLRPVLCINVLDFSLIKDYSKPHTVFIATEKDRSELRLTEHFEMHFIELPKFEQSGRSMKQHLADWMIFLNNEGTNGDVMKTVFESNPAIQKAHDEYLKFTGDREYIEAYEAHMKWKSDHNTLMRSAREEGLAEGIEQGRAEGIEQGLEKGIAQGIEQGLEKGIEKGIAQGKTEAARETARAMLTENDPIEKIARVSGLSIEEIEKLR